MKGKKGNTDNGIAILHKRYIQGDKKKLQALKTERDNTEIAQQIYDLRTRVGLSQRALAEKVGTTPSVICRLENSDYNGHSLLMLNRIASALNHRVKIELIPE